MRTFLAFLLVLTMALPALAQDSEDDGGSFLERLIQDKLSGAGREVTIRGFQGALSSRATMEELTISDADGVWLTVRNAVLDWSRAALLRGDVRIEELSAEEILLPRLPKSGDTGPGVEQSEAKPFSLPDLPVSINIGRVQTDRLELGEALIGQDAVLKIDGSLRLADGAGAADIAATRTDAEGSFGIDASYANESRELAVDVAFSEGPNGIVAGLAGLPGNPPLELTVQGQGPLSNFAADLAFSTDAVQRIAGRVTLSEPEDAPGTSRFALDITGDVAPLVAERLRAFFGDETRLAVEGTRRADGGTELSRLDLSTGALTLAGSLALAPTGLPERLDLNGRLAGPVVLPVAGPETRVNGVTLSAEFDQSTSDRWQADIVLDELDRAELSLARAHLAGNGTIRPQDPAAITADLIFDAQGLTHDDLALARALGAAAEGTASLSWAKGEAIEISDLRVTSGRVRAGLQGTLGDAAAGLPFDGRVQLAVDDLARFAPIAGRDLGGAAEARVSGSYRLLDGIFDLTLDANTRDLATGTPQLDPLLRGQGSLDLSAARGPEGTDLRKLDLRTGAVTLTAGGQLSSGAGGMVLSGDVRDLSLVDARLEGPGTLDAAVKWEGGGQARIETLEVRGSGAALTATGAVTPEDPSLPAEGQVDLSVRDLSLFSGLAGRPLAGTVEAHLEGRGALKGDFEAALDANGQRLVLGIAEADKVIAGQAQVVAKGARRGGALIVDALDLETPNLTVRANGAGGGALDLSARLADLALLVPGFPGPVTVNGRAAPQGANWRLDIDLTAPAGTTARVSGTLAQDVSRGDLRITGQAPLTLANPFIDPQSIDGTAAFDLALNGPLGLSALSGRATASGARLAVPAAGLALTDLGGTVGLSGGRAQIDIAGRLDGGRLTVSGPVTLSAPFDANLAIGLDEARLRDPALYETNLNGRITVTGPLTGGATIGGRIDVGRTEVTVAPGGAGASGPIPDIAHRGETAAVRATLRRAGLIQTESSAGGGGPAFPLDLLISAPSQIFVRGRGLDAELGGQLRLRGTSADVVPIGEFELIRGRLDILAQRFSLDEGLVTLQGSLDPYLRFAANTQTGDITAQIVIEGLASSPEIHFYSQPEMPEEEVISQVLFARNLDDLSAFQAAQLAAAVAELAGRGGDGLFARLRKGTGLDNIDIGEGADGGTEVRAGKYLSDNLYSEVTANSQGRSEIDLNLDLTDSVTVKGSVDDAGDTGIGIFFKRDY